MNAYHGDAALKRSLLELLADRFADGRLRFCQTVWDGERGSPLGCIMSADDPAGLGVRYGFPLALCHLLDPLAAEVGASGRAPGAYVMQWMEAVPVGAALDMVPFDLMAWMLEHGEAPDALATALAARHRADRAGDPDAARLPWRALRRQAVSLADAADAAPGARFHEAAATSLHQSPSSLSVAFEEWVALPDGAARDWTDADEERVERLLSSDASSDPAGPSPMERLAAQDRPLAVRLRHHLEHGAERRHARANQVADRLLELLRGAAIAASA